MSKLIVKTTYEQCADPYGSTEVIDMYCEHNMSCDTITFYHDDGRIMDMFFEEWSSGKDKWDAVMRLMYPFKGEWGKDLEDGVEYSRLPFEK